MVRGIVDVPQRSTSEGSEQLTNARLQISIAMQINLQNEAEDSVRNTKGLRVASENLTGQL